MDVTINEDRRLFVIQENKGYSCLGFDVVFKKLRQIVSILNLSLPVNEDEVGTMAQYALYQKAVSEAARAKIKETWFDPDTPPEVRRVLERYRKSGEILRIFYGDTKTGRDWMAENDVLGKIGRSTGTFKVPLMIEPGEYGGPAILDDCIVRMQDGSTGRELYRHPLYWLPEMEIRSTDGMTVSWHHGKPQKSLADMGYTHGVWVKNKKGEFENHANFKSYGKACRYVAFISGDSVCKP
jgi:hypothetical protein